MNLDFQTLQGYIDQQKSDDFFRSLGFDKGRQGAIDQASNLRMNDPAYKAQQLIQTSIDAYTKQLESYNKRYGEYTENNPFIFDQVLEEESAKALQRLDPYYQQTLGDYLQGVNTKKTRSLQDERTLLTELQRTSDTYVGNEKAQLEDAIDSSQQGKADAGIYDSGARLREEGKLRADSNKQTDNFLHAQDTRQKGIQQTTQRGMDDLKTGENMYTRDLNREKEYQVNSQALPEVTRRQGEYEFGRQQYAGVAPGVNPLQFQNSLYNLLG